MLDGGAGEGVDVESKVSHCVVTTTSPDVDFLDGCCCCCGCLGAAGICEKFPTDHVRIPPHCGGY
ncbi:hypothetical protein HanIR_Chr17g0858921 [Helianthus annuus]|nr:hypothetical protein HanIR_Chr17g0858921 [Helianthus annuus]